jgi:2-C-methyl-D-erythritol 2,4-cyclodiphosphate synthase
MKYRVGQGFDSHPTEAGRRLVLGGVEIPHDIGLRGHSDADVAAHALAGAIIGALGDGDLGTIFPDDDPKFKSADSIELLARAWSSASSRGWRLVNADVTIVAQAPRLRPYLVKMRERLAIAVGADTVLVNVKASSPEGLGALGRSEGISALAIVMLEAD